MAHRLLKELELRAIVQIDGASVARIHIKNQGTKTVGERERILEFVVERIEPQGRVRLSLDGVIVYLTF